MKKSWIPFPYKIILKRFWSDSDFGRIALGKARTILVYIYRMGNKNAGKILREMRDYRFIDFDKRFVMIRVSLVDLADCGN